MSDFPTPTISQAAVTVTSVPGTSQAILVDEGGTVADAIRQAGLQTDGFRVAVNGEVVTDFSRTVQNGDRITVARQVKGN